jgi:hypothetical protein
MIAFLPQTEHPHHNVKGEAAAVQSQFEIGMLHWCKDAIGHARTVDCEHLAASAPFL